MASIKRKLSAFRNKPVAKELKPLFDDILSELSALRGAANNAVLSSAGLVIKAGGQAIVKAGSAFMAIADGTPLYKVADTDMSALAGTAANGKYALWAFYINSAGTITTSAKTADADTAAAALALMPAVPSGRAQIGAVIIVRANVAGYVGGTTALDDGDTTVIYINNTGPVANVSAVMAA